MSLFWFYWGAVFLWSTVLFAQQAPLTLYLWEKGSRNDVATPKSERPRIDIYLPEKNTNNGQMVLICPGGGYTKTYQTKKKAAK